MLAILQSTHANRVSTQTSTGDQPNYPVMGSLRAFFTQQYSPAATKQARRAITLTGYLLIAVVVLTTITGRDLPTLAYLPLGLIGVLYLVGYCKFHVVERVETGD